MLNGTMVHEVFQKAAVAKDFSLETLSKLADQALCSPQHLGLMCVLYTYAPSHFHHLFSLFSCTAVQQLLHDSSSKRCGALQNAVFSFSW